MSKKKKIWIAIGVAVLIIVLAAVFIINRLNATTVDGMDPEEMDIVVQKVTEEELDESILVTGTIVPEDEQKIYAEAENGNIKEFKVKENDKVKKGDTLFIYDSTALDREFEAAVRARNLTQNSISSTQHQINQLQKDIDVMKKVQNAPDEDGAPDIKDEIKSLELEKTQLSLELEGTKAEVASAQDEINAIDDQRKALTVKSKIDGTIVKVNKNLEITEDGTTEPAVHIISSKPFKVIGTMSEFDAVKIKDKQRVTIIPKVYKDREWQGEVESVSQHPSDEGMGEDMYGMGESNVTMYPFTVNITDDTSELRQGFHVSLEVSIGGDEKKVVVPHAALMDDMMMYDPEDEEAGMMEEVFPEDDFSELEESAFVYVLTDENILERRDVETGKMNDEFIEIVSGVELGELVVISPMMEMYDGMEVTSYDEAE